MGTNSRSYYLKWYAKNRERKLASDRAWQAANPAKVYAYSVKKRYGITVKEYEARRRRKTCEICKRPFSTPKQKHLDHCHVTKILRGVLCSFCNLALGLMRDDSRLLRKAAAYLDKYKET